MFKLEPEHNLWDNEHPEWFIYDPELLNAWYWEQCVIELEGQYLRKKGWGYLEYPRCPYIVRYPTVIVVVGGWGYGVVFVYIWECDEYDEDGLGWVEDW